MKNKIGIVTVYGENNFGNKLQNYASVKLYSNLGFEVETLKVTQSRMVLGKKDRIKCSIKKIIKYIPKYNYLNYQLLKEKKFRKFSERELNLVGNYNTKSINKDILEKYNYLSVGSDQVWNDTDFDTNDMNYFSLLDIKTPKIIALSPSLGKTSLFENNAEILRKALMNYTAVSCREQQGADYIEELIGKKCKVLVDPTMALSIDDWISVEKKPDWYDGKRYTFSYFLGGIGDNIDFITGICDKNKIYNINILDKKSRAYNTSPEEFIYLIHNSEIVFTDSFHACVFSIIFNKDFVVFKRKNQESEMGSRIDNLFKLFGIDKYEYGKIYNFSELNDKDKVLESKRKEVLEYIKEAIEL